MDQLPKYASVQHSKTASQGHAFIEHTGIKPDHAGD